MSRFHGKGGKFTVGSAEVTGVTSFSYDETADSVDATAMGDTSKQYLGGLRDGSGTVEARLFPSQMSGDTGQGAMLDALAVGTGVTVSFDIAAASDLSSGDLSGLTGAVIVNSFAMSQSFDDVINITFGYQGTLSRSYKA